MRKTDRRKDRSKKQMQNGLKMPSKGHQRGPNLHLPDSVLGCLLEFVIDMVGTMFEASIGFEQVSDATIDICFDLLFRGGLEVIFIRLKSHLNQTSKSGRHKVVSSEPLDEG